jgi:hypothetical protein
MDIAYNSCRNRHCPKCQGANAKQWLAARQADLLPVDYYHVVFTLPAAIVSTSSAPPTTPVNRSSSVSTPRWRRPKPALQGGVSNGFQTPP